METVRVWTIQPIEVWEELNKKGYFICNPDKAENISSDYNFKEAYSWLIFEMEKRIGKRPKGVEYPIWAWYRRNWKNKKPDLREAAYDRRGTKSVCIELELPINDVVLSDYDAWHFVLNKWYNDNSTNEEDWEKEQEWFDKLALKERESVMRKSWQKIFDITPMKTDWRINGAYVQATFWVLRLSDVRDVRFFTCK